jgi:ribosome maturation factor RimP
MSEQLRALIQPVVEGLGFDLWGLEYLNQGKHSALKIYIEAEKGIDVDDCAAVSRQVSSLLDVEDPLKGNYTLEVSSPGLDRRFFELSQFDQFKGSQVKVNLRQPFEGKRKFKGLLCGVEDDDVVIRHGEEEILVPLAEIDRAQVIPVFD